MTFEAVERPSGTNLLNQAVPSLTEFQSVALYAREWPLKRPRIYNNERTVTPRSQIESLIGNAVSELARASRGDSSCNSKASLEGRRILITGNIKSRALL